MSTIDRRRFAAICAGIGLGATGLPDRLGATDSDRPGVTDDDLVAAARLAGLELTAAERELMLAGVQQLRADYERLRTVKLGNSVPPALRFDPRGPAANPSRSENREEAFGRASTAKGERQTTTTPDARPRTMRVERPTGDDELAFLSVGQLSRLVRQRAVSSVELTRLALERLRRYDPVLHCVITLTEERALAQAEQADGELARGRWRGPLHGIPWGAKDLLAVRGYPTTWGATPFRDQELEEDATVVRRLDDAGAVLVAKLALGALAWGDVWFGGMTRNPWDPEQGSSGSSAGPAAATAAGLVGFAIGSETWGSIVSPCTRCGATGLRPTFGRVSRHGAMALSWTMDKLGPIARSAEDCALVFDAIRGADPMDPTTVDQAFRWHPEIDVLRLRVGYVRSLFETETDEEEGREVHRLDLEALQVLREMGVELIPIELPQLPIGALSFILSAEAAAAFDELTRSGRDDLLVRQIEQAWPNAFRQARTIPAVEYIQANRVRTLAMREMERTLDGIDVYVCPSFGGDNLLLTNLTGHPAVVVPHGFRDDGTPTSITFCGRLDAEAETLAVAMRFQEATGHHLHHPEVEV